ncbi:SPW repeat protein [Dyadobacter sp. CY345]|uniref:SPW repeat domain-containing protein n=1 Tax=Dyadobacter sp. CY345 TaxID=2909335 RepID=UPI001F458C02|nr:SPW repeat protein [Dyadobacter sp. CY345]MCF2446720.1 SPW repeat protein [Dyadobacter sp. CY345]
MKILSTKVHGILDYLSGILLIALPWILGFDDVETASRVVLVVGVMILLMSVLTNYEAGFLKRIPMNVHLNIDIVTGLLLAASPWILGFSDQVYLPHLIMGLFETVAAAATYRQPKLAM